MNYNPADLLPAWDNFIKAAYQYRNADGFQYDLVDITRQVLANYALPLHRKIAEAYFNHNIDSFELYSLEFLELMDDMDRLLATRKDFLLGSWLANAKRWGNTNAESNLYEQNARDLITLWGDRNSPLHEYSCRQWSGLIKDFYKYRWNIFFNEAKEALLKGENMDVASFKNKISGWEWTWVNEHNIFPSVPSGNAVETAMDLYHKYRDRIEKAYVK